MRAGLAFSLLLLVMPVASALGQTAVERCVQNAANDLLRASQVGTPAAFKRAIERHADIQAVALFALGPFRRQLPNARRTEYVRLVSDFIARTLANNHRRFSATGARISRSYRQGDMVIVETVLLPEAERQDVPLRWRVMPRGQGCRIVDLSVENVWLAAQLRSVITNEIRRKGNRIEAAFDYLRAT